jgi:hypothetical protein
VISIILSLIFTSVGTAVTQPLQTPLAKKNPVKFSPHFYLCFREKKNNILGCFSSLSFSNWGRKETVAGFRIGNDDDGLGERRAHLNR